MKNVKKINDEDFDLVDYILKSKIEKLKKINEGKNRTITVLLKIEDIGLNVVITKTI